MAIKKYGHVQVILYAVGLWAVSFPFAAFLMYSSFSESCPPCPCSKSQAAAKNTSDPHSVPEDFTKDWTAFQKKRSEEMATIKDMEKQALRAERKASIKALSHEDSGEVEQIDWQWITKAQYIRLLKESGDQEDKLQKKIKELRNSVCYDGKSENLEFDPTYKKVDAFMEKPVYQKHGINDAQWAKLMKYHTRDKMVRDYMRQEQRDKTTIVQEKTKKDLDELPKDLQDMKYEKVMEIQKMSHEESKNIVLQLRWTDDREDTYSVQGASATVSLMTSQRVFKKHQVTEDQLNALFSKFSKELMKDNEYIAELQFQMGEGLNDLKEACDPLNWKEKEAQLKQDMKKVDDSYEEEREEQQENWGQH